MLQTNSLQLSYISVLQFFEPRYKMKKPTEYLELKAKIDKLLENPVEYDTENVISYTQLERYMRCPKCWELGYAKGLRSRDSSIHLIFGTAMHETLQNYLDVCYNESFKAADEIPLGEYLKNKMKEHYEKESKKMQSHFTTATELGEFWLDGIQILNWIKSHRRVYFNSRRYYWLGAEIPLHLIVQEQNKEVKYIAYLDLVLWDIQEHRVHIIDIKTSGRGWNKYQKEDDAKKAQVILYKKYFNKQFGTRLEDINVSFFIVRRKLWENSDYPQKRVQEFSPAQGKTTLNKFTGIIEEFVSDCFNSDGTYNLDKVYPAITGKDGKNCKFCEFKDNEDLCPTSQRSEA